jgi:aromatic-amino-acid transaminase
MTSKASASIFSAIAMAPRDPILGITEAFNADTNPAKINLGVGVYYDDNGKVPLLQCVRKAEALMIEQHTPRTYLPIEGLAAYDKAVQELVFGADSAVIQEKRAITVQAVGGTGALKIGADFLQRFAPKGSQVYISDPSWENHRALFEGAGFVVNNYAYYDEATHGVNFDGMLAALKAMPQGSIVLLHACCHNPTGADLLVSNSFSKSFSLYGERVGALSVVAASGEEAARVLSQLKRVVRTNYSNPPLHGGKVVATVLATPELRQLWEEELAAMRVRIKETRGEFVRKLKEKAPGRDFEFVREQVGMFSYSGLTKDQVEKLRADSIYAVDTGRICVAALNSKNIDLVIDAIAKVL